MPPCAGPRRHGRFDVARVPPRAARGFRDFRDSTGQVHTRLGFESDSQEAPLQKNPESLLVSATKR